MTLENFLGRPNGAHVIKLKFGMKVEVDEWCHDPISGEGQGHETKLKCQNLPIFNLCLCLLSVLELASWQMTDERPPAQQEPDK